MSARAGGRDAEQGSATTMKSPRLITIGLILAFCLPIAIQHFVYFLVEDRGVSSQPNENDVTARRQLRSYINSRMGLFDWVERVDYDLHLRSTSAGAISPNVAIVEIGEKSLKDLGQFPFTRTIYRGFLERLEKAGAKVVAFDVAFPEHDARIDMLTELRKVRHEVEQVEGFDSRAVKQIDARIFAIDADEDFSTALHNTKLPVVLGFTLTGAGEDLPVTEEVRSLLFPYGMFRRSYLDTSALSSYTGFVPVLSIAEIMRSLNKNSSVGHFNPEMDSDSVIRAIPAVLEFEGHVFGSLAVRALGAYYDEEPIIDGEGTLSIKGITHDASGDSQPGKMAFPINVDGTFLLNYYGGAHTFPFIEFSDVMKDRFTSDQLKEKVGGKIIFVGATALGLKDQRATPFSPNYPGVETHATMASNVIQKTFMLRDQRFFLFGYLFVIAFTALVSLAVFRFHPLYSFLASLASVTTMQFLAQLCFARGVVVPSLLPSAAVMTMFFAGVLYRYFTEEREKKVVRAAFSRYVSGAVVDEILRDQTKLRLGGQKKELTLMFVDLVEFTKLTERLDATFVTQLLNEYFTRMTTILLRNKGTLDKYMGDGLMCFWGAPLELADHARLACVTALEMQQDLARLNIEWKAKHGITVGSRIGVHTGVMAVGNMGSDQVFSYTVMGDNVNLCSRLEGVNTVYGTSIVVSAATAAQAGAGFLLRPLDRVQVKGREDFVDILELVSARGEKEPEWIHAFATGLKHYQAGEWSDAESAFGACLSLKPLDGPSIVFVDRIHDFRIVEPDDWVGVWKLSSK
jgi:adenylate cyclase